MAVQQFDTFISYRRNTGSQLASRIYDYLLSKGKKPFLDIAEMNGGRFDTQLRHRVRSAFNFVLEIPDYWYEDSVQKGFSCPQCGNPCHCACVIFEKYL